MVTIFGSCGFIFGLWIDKTATLTGSITPCKYVHRHLTLRFRSIFNVLMCTAWLSIYLRYVPGERFDSRCNCIYTLCNIRFFNCGSVAREVAHQIRAKLLLLFWLFDRRQTEHFHINFYGNLNSSLSLRTKQQHTRTKLGFSGMETHSYNKKKHTQYFDSSHDARAI